MATPERPGWYPAPNGGGEQWWNGVSWSESRRDGTVARQAVTHSDPALEQGPAARSNITPQAARPPAPLTNVTPPAYRSSAPAVSNITPRTPPVPPPYRGAGTPAVPPPYQGAGYQPLHTGGTASSQVSGAATGALITGIISLFFQILGIVAIILGAVALRQAKAGDAMAAKGKTMAVIGIVLGVVGLLIGAFNILIWVLALMSSTVDYTNS
jgi:hypothetical protein